MAVTRLIEVISSFTEATICLLFQLAPFTDPFTCIPNYSQKKQNVRLDPKNQSAREDVFFVLFCLMVELYLLSLFSETIKRKWNPFGGKQKCIWLKIRFDLRRHGSHRCWSANLFSLFAWANILFLDFFSTKKIIQTQTLDFPLSFGWICFFSVSTPFSICWPLFSITFLQQNVIELLFFPFVYSFIFASYGSICHQWWVECNHFSSETLMSWLFWIVEQLNLHNSLFFVTFSTFGFSKLIFQYSGNRLLFS